MALALRIILTTAAIPLMAGPTFAQQTLDAGALQQQIERQQNAPRVPVAPAPAPAPRAMVPDQSINVTVSRFEFVGNTWITTEQLQQAVASFLGRPLRYVDLQAAAAAAANVYREAGWVVRTFLPEQDVSGGVVRIQVIEAIFGQIDLQAVDPTDTLLLAVTPDNIRERLRTVQREGEAINTQALDRAILLIDDLAGIAADGSLKTGQKSGETDLVLRISNEPFFSGNVQLDNTGPRSTGRERLGMNLAFNSPMKVGDAVNLHALHTKGTNYGRVAYRLPVGVDGWTIGAVLSDLRYRLVGADFAALDSRGSAKTAGLSAAYPLLRTRQSNLALTLSADRKQYVNSAGASTTSDYGIDALTASLDGNRPDDMGGGGNFYGNLSLVTGTVDLAGSPNAAADAGTARTAGSFRKLRYGLTRQQAIDDDFSLLVSWKGQLSDKNLDSAEKFYLGGDAGVRAYPASEAGGSEGDLVNLELITRLADGWNLIAFYDWGRVRINRQNNFSGGLALNRFSLEGAGVSISWSDHRHSDVRLTWARRIGNNPNPTLTGMDQDGTRIKDRFWLTASVFF